MPATVELLQVREVRPAPGLTIPAPDTAPALPEPTTYWGDRFALRLWFAGASILAVLHLVEWLYFLLRP